MPASSSASICSRCSVAGPSVQTILVRRIVVAPLLFYFLLCLFAALHLRPGPPIMQVNKAARAKSERRRRGPCLIIWHAGPEQQGYVRKITGGPACAADAFRGHIT